MRRRGSKVEQELHVGRRWRLGEAGLGSSAAMGFARTLARAGDGWQRGGVLRPSRKRSGAGQRGPRRALAQERGDELASGKQRKARETRSDWRIGAGAGSRNRKGRGQQHEGRPTSIT